MKPKIKLPKGWRYVPKDELVMEGDKFWVPDSWVPSAYAGQIVTDKNRYIRKIKKRGKK